jgi:hypothetical protein
MLGNFVLEFFDLIVHLIPGTVVLAIPIFLVYPDVFSSEVKNATLLILIEFVAAFLAGFLVQLLAQFVLGAVERVVTKIRKSYKKGKTAWLLKLPFLQKILDTPVKKNEIWRCIGYLTWSNPEVGDVRKLAQDKLGVHFHDQVRLYRYAEAVVEKKMRRSYTKAKRIEALSILSRNLLLVDFILLIFLLIAYLHCENIPSAAGGIMWWEIASIPFLGYGWYVYWKRSIDLIFWAFVSWCRMVPEKRTPSLDGPR